MKSEPSLISVVAFNLGHWCLVVTKISSTFLHFCQIWNWISGASLLMMMMMMMMTVYRGKISDHLVAFNCLVIIGYIAFTFCHSTNMAFWPVILHWFWPFLKQQVWICVCMCTPVKNLWIFVHGIFYGPQKQLKGAKVLGSVWMPGLRGIPTQRPPKTSPTCCVLWIHCNQPVTLSSAACYIFHCQSARLHCQLLQQQAHVDSLTRITHSTQETTVAQK